MEDNRVQTQISLYMTNKKLCEFNDKLKPAPVEYYAHVHAQGEKARDGSRQRSCIGLVLQDYVSANKTDCVVFNPTTGKFISGRFANGSDNSTPYTLGISSLRLQRLSCLL